MAFSASEASKLMVVKASPKTIKRIDLFIES
jgi:hypothetical protein